jgi:LmbE family N-acetylglucosaminyl deacetylase
MNVLAIGAHPDDLEEFCGGTLALYARGGHRVTMCVVTDGQANPLGKPEEIAAIRKLEAQASADLIGAELVWMGILDGRVMVDEATRNHFVDIIRAAAPDVIITHPPDDYHPDHNCTSQLVIQATQGSHTANYPSELPPLRGAMPIAFMDAECGINFLPEEYVDISTVWETKAAMLLTHRSQCMPNRVYDPDYVMPPAEQISLYREMRILSEFRGLSAGSAYAEGFRWWRVAYRLRSTRVLP